MDVKINGCFSICNDFLVIIKLLDINKGYKMNKKPQFVNYIDSALENSISSIHQFQLILLILLHCI